MQYATDRAIKDMDKLPRAINVLDCLAEKALQEREMLLFFFSPVLAAQAGFNNCYYLKNFGSSGLVSRCRPAQANFTAQLNPCACQPYF